MNAVLVIQLARMGDLLQTKRLLLSLAQADATTRVYLCVDSTLHAFAAQIYPFAEIISLPAHNTASRSPMDVLADAKTCFDILQNTTFSKVYTLNQSPLSFALARLFPEQIVMGYSADHGQPTRNYLCKLAARWTADRVTAPMNLVDFWAYFHPAPITPERVNPIARAGGYHRIGVALAGREQRRSLPTPVLAKCIEAVFRARGGPQIVCIGTKQEQRHVRELAQLLPSSMFAHLEDMTGRTALTDLPELISSLDCLLTPDTGIMHLAAHLGVPVQGFFLSSAWCFETGPYGLGHTVWQATTPCAPCLESAPCRHGLDCLEAFRHRALLLHLSGRYTPEWPEHLTSYISQFDMLGVTYKPVDGHDPGHDKRQALRQVLTGHLTQAPITVPSAVPEALFYDGDWMLPHREDII